MLHEWFDWIVHKLLFKPVYKLYTLVWWQNQSDTHICATLSPGTSRHFWDTHTGECQQMIYTRFQTFYTAMNCLLWFACLHQLYVILWYICITSCTQRRVLRGALRGAIQDVMAEGNARLTLQPLHPPVTEECDDSE